MAVTDLFAMPEEKITPVGVAIISQADARAAAEQSGWHHQKLLGDAMVAGGLPVDMSCFEKAGGFIPSEFNDSIKIAMCLVGATKFRIENDDELGLKFITWGNLSS